MYCLFKIFWYMYMLCSFSKCRDEKSKIFFHFIMFSLPFFVSPSLPESETVFIQWQCSGYPALSSLNRRRWNLPLLSPWSNPPPLNLQSLRHGGCVQLIIMHITKRKYSHRGVIPQVIILMLTFFIFMISHWIKIYPACICRSEVPTLVENH